MMIRPLVWLLLLGSLWALTPKANAGYANVVPSPGFRGGAVGAPSNPLTYTRTAANAPWFSGTAAGQVTANVGGRAVTMPAQARVAANAGRFLAAAVRLNPAAVAITGVALVLGNLVWSELEQQWRVELPDSQWCGVDGSFFNACASTAGLLAQAHADAYRAVSGACWDGSKPAITPVNLVISGTTATWNLWSEGCPGYSGAIVRDGGGHEEAAEGGSRPAEAADWLPLEDKPPCYGGYDVSPGDCWGDELPNEWPQVVDPAGLPLPLEVPKVNPNPGPNPNPNPAALPVPMRAPTGDPVLIPGSDPAQWRQPVVDIIPSPTPGEPWRVDLQPKDIVLDDPADGLTEPEPLGSGDPAGTPSEQQQQLCEVYPDIVACMQPGEPEDVELDAEERDVSFTPASGFGAGNASCPADKQLVTSLAGTLSLSWGPACQFATGLRPVVIALAALSGALIFLGGFKGAD